MCVRVRVCVCPSILPGRRVRETECVCEPQAVQHSLAALLQPIRSVKQAVRFYTQVGEVRIHSLLLTIQAGWQPFPKVIANCC